MTPTGYMGPFPIHSHRTLAEMDTPERGGASFTDEECAVICERRKYQSAAELAKVFDTNSYVIAAIVRKGV